MRSRSAIPFTALSALTAGLFLLDLAVGAVRIPVADVWAALTGGDCPQATAKIVVNIRLIKAVVALLAGAALSVSGLQMQTLFRNPLAGPYVLGISSGASLGVALVVLAGIGSSIGVAAAAWIGAAAVLLEPDTEGYGVIDSILRSDGSGELQLYMKAGGSRYPASIETVQNNWHTIMWDGHAVFKAAVSKMADVSVEMMERHHLSSDDIRYLVPHQANLRIIDATARRMGITSDKCMINIDRNGNTTAATIPSCLYDYEKELRRGDNLILSAFGGGYTWGAIYVKWAYDGEKA